jgi:hypothetical protein
VAAPGLVSPRVPAPTRSPPDPRSPPVRLTSWTAPCSAFSTWGQGAVRPQERSRLKCPDLRVGSPRPAAAWRRL